MHTSERAGGMLSFLWRQRGKYQTNKRDVDLGVVRRSADMSDAVVIEPFGQVAGDIAGAVIGEQPWTVNDPGLIEACGFERQFECVCDVIGFPIL